MFRNLTSPKVRPELPIAVSVATDDVFAAIAVKDSLSWDKQNGPKKNGYDHQQSTSINKHQRPIQQEPNCTQHTRVETCRQQPTTRKVCKKRLLNYSLSTLSGALATLWPTGPWRFPSPFSFPFAFVAFPSPFASAAFATLPTFRTFVSPWWWCAASVLHQHVCSDLHCLNDVCRHESQWS